MKLPKMIISPILVVLFLLGCVSAPEVDQPEPLRETAPLEQASQPSSEAAAPTGETTEPAPEVSEPTKAPEETKPFALTVIPVVTGPQNQVTVTTVDEFLAAIAPDTEILVDAPLLDFSKATGYGDTDGEYYYWNEAFDGPELCITGVSNLTVRGNGADHTENVLSSVPRYSYVLTFENCANIHVFSLTAGHTKEPGYCTGGVLCFRNSQDILVEDCGLFGCGTLGVMADSSKNIQIVKNDIYECSVGGVEFFNCDNVNVDGNTFRDLGGPDFRVYSCGTITCNGEPVHDFSPRQ